MANLHYLKSWPEFYEAMKSGIKTFDYRKNDRGFQVGDIVIQMKYDPNTPEPQATKDMFIYAHDHEMLTFEITFLVTSAPGLPEGYCIMQCKPWE